MTPHEPTRVVGAGQGDPAAAVDLSPGSPDVGAARDQPDAQRHDPSTSS